MARSTCEVADVVGRHGEAFVRTRAVNAAKIRILRSIQACRTAALGGRKLECPSCDHTVVLYNSCRNRHCPKCGGGQRAKWVERQQRRLLPVTYFHVVFTLPNQLASIALQNQRRVYGLLLRAAAETLLQLARDPKHLGAHIGATTVLHTWGQNLEHHPHVHCLVPGGGLDLERERWRPCRSNFLLPVRVMRALFRGKLLAGLGEAYRKGQLELHGSLAGLRQPAAFWRLLRPLRKRKWVVYAKRPAAGPEVVLKYLARYVGRVAIANSRIVTVDKHRVSFRWLDRRDGQRKLMNLDGPEFLRRFCLHILPRGFVRIRHFGLLSNRAAGDLGRCQKLLEPSSSEGAEPVPKPKEGNLEDSSAGQHTCPGCGAVLVVVAVVRQPMVVDIYALWMDSS